MMWRGENRRAGVERRVAERRRTMRYNVRTLLIINGITWVDPEGGRRTVRRRADREALVTEFVRRAGQVSFYDGRGSPPPVFAVMA